MTENTGARYGGAPGSRGRTTIADVVVEKIAGMAARDVRGVYALGSGFARSMGSMRERMPGAGSGKSATRGVSVEVGEKQAAIDLEIVVDYGVSITDVAWRWVSPRISVTSGLSCWFWGWASSDSWSGGSWKAISNRATSSAAGTGRSGSAMTGDGHGETGGSDR